MHSTLCPSQCTSCMYGAHTLYSIHSIPTAQKPTQTSPTASSTLASYSCILLLYPTAASYNCFRRLYLKGASRPPHRRQERVIIRRYRPLGDPHITVEADQMSRHRVTQGVVPCHAEQDTAGCCRVVDCEGGVVRVHGCRYERQRQRRRQRHRHRHRQRQRQRQKRGRYGAVVRSKMKSCASRIPFGPTTAATSRARTASRVWHDSSRSLAREKQRFMSSSQKRRPT